jgi:hypothetical protein
MFCSTAAARPASESKPGIHCPYYSHMIAMTIDPPEWHRDSLTN